MGRKERRIGEKRDKMVDLVAWCNAFLLSFFTLFEEARKKKEVDRKVNETS